MNILKFIFVYFPELMFIYILTLSFFNQKYYYYFIYIIIIYAILGIFKILLNKVKSMPKFMYRPNKSFACNLGIKKSNKGDIGMPSFHSIVAGYFITLSIKYNNILLFVISLIVPFSRLDWNNSSKIISKKYGCHTKTQVIIGFVIGILLGILSIKQIN